MSWSEELELVCAALRKEREESELTNDLRILHLTERVSALERVSKMSGQDADAFERRIAQLEYAVLRRK